MTFTSRTTRIGAVILAVALICSIVLTGCSQQLAQSATNEEESGPTSRSFMAAMNEAADDLKEKMAAFTDAVAREDMVSMRVQSDAAFAVIDQMAAIEAPEELTELRQRYVDGCTQLKDVLTGYLDLYQEVDSSTYYDPFDYDAYPDRIAELQGRYDAAVQALEDADKAATEM